MARVTLTPQQIVRTGLAPVFAGWDAGLQHGFANDGRIFAQVKNTNAAVRTVTVQTPGTVDGLAVAERTVNIPATTGDVMIGPFPPSAYNQADGQVYLDIDVVLNVTIAIFRL
jgi:hypothetical protein